MLLSVRWYERVRRHYRVTLRRARLSHLRAGHAAHRRRLRPGHAGDRDSRRGLPAGLPQDRAAGAPAACRPATRSATCRCAASGCSRTRCAPSACATIGPGDSPRRLHWKATARAPGQALQVKLLRADDHVIACTSCSTSAPSDQNWSWQGYDPRGARGGDHHGRVGRQLGHRTRLSGRPGGERQAVSLERRGAHRRPAATRTS